MKKYVLLISVILFFSTNSKGQNDAKSFCESYDCSSGLEFYEKNEILIDSICKVYSIEPKLLFSIVSPEVVHYSNNRDIIETRVSELFYVNIGNGYGDFSLGTFQMKPSFAEELEEYVKENFKEDSILQKHINYNAESNKEERKERIFRIRSKEWGITYACLFAKIVADRFPNVGPLKSREQVRFYATAYNSGFLKPYEHLLKFRDKKMFPRWGKTKHNYSDCAFEIYLKTLEL